MARYAVLLYAPVSDDGEQPSAEDLAVYEHHAEELRSSGVMSAAYRLQPPETATSLRPGLMTDGPFIESKEVIAGFYVIEAPDLDSALTIARRNPILQDGGGLEVRPLVE